MVELVKNERSWAIELISLVNDFLNSRTLDIKKASGEVTINNSKKAKKGDRRIMFPDMLLYGDSRKSLILQGWEIKMPDVPITNTSFILDAQQKADSLGLNSTVLWNFKEAVLYVKNKDNIWEIHHQWNDSNIIKTRKDVELYEKEWKNTLKKVLTDLSIFLREGSIQTATIDYVLSNNLMVNLLHRNQKLVAEYLEAESKTNRILHSYIDHWWTEKRLEYYKDEVSSYSAFSKVILTNWIIKFTFAHLIKKDHTPAYEVENIQIGNTPKEANVIFKNITNKCDFYTIFYPLEYSDLLPPFTWNDLINYNYFLSDQGINTLNQEAIQVFLENSVNKMRREIIGQFTTPTLLAELLVKSTIVDPSGDTIDPCAGSGTIIKAAKNLKREFLSSEETIDSTWASDKYQYPLQLTNLTLTDFYSMEKANKVFQKNVFKIRVGSTIQITSPKTKELKSYDIPKFSAIVSNLPFVPFEKISQEEKLYLSEYSEIIKDKTEINLSKRSDLYTYITFHLWGLLESKGRVGLILSNSWLGTLSGKEFFSLLQKMYHIEYILISGKKRWFKNADVVTTMVILTKKEITDKKKEVKFGVLKIPLENLSDANTMKAISNHILLDTSAPTEIITTSSYEQNILEDFLEYGISLNALFHKVEWLFEIKNKLTPLSQKFTVFRGERRGWDQLFFPDKGHNIDPEYIQPVLKTIKDVKGLTTSPKNIAFCCSDSLEKLKEKNNFGTIEWISKFQHAVNGVGKPLPEVLAKKNLHWYEMSPDSLADLVTTMNPNKRLFYSKLDAPGFINQRLIGLKINGLDSELDLNHALLNSLIGNFFIEATGFGRGLGALDLNATKLSKTYMLDSDLLSNKHKVKILNAFEPLKQRNLNDFSVDIKMQDRIHFEKIVLESFGLSQYFDRIVYSITSMKNSRLTALDT